MSDNIIDGFDEESLRLWESIGTDKEYIQKFEKLAENMGYRNPPKVVKPKPISKEHIKELMENSLLCVENSKKLLDKYMKAEQYFKANEMRVAGILHNNFVKRLQNILDGKPPFED